MVDAHDIPMHPEDISISKNSQGAIYTGTNLNDVKKPGLYSERLNDSDPVNHPSHYKGLEVIQLTEQMNFNKGNAVKYVARAGIKDEAKEIEDLEKAKWYIQREIDRIKGEN